MTSAVRNTLIVCHGASTAFRAGDVCLNEGVVQFELLQAALAVQLLRESQTVPQPFPYLWGDAPKSPSVQCFGDV